MGHSQAGVGLFVVFAAFVTAERLEENFAIGTHDMDSHLQHQLLPIRLFHGDQDGIPARIHILWYAGVSAVALDREPLWATLFGEGRADGFQLPSASFPDFQCREGDCFGAILSLHH
jgi:hypothetical protein